jgi:hypothetical protein
MSTPSKEIAISESKDKKEVELFDFYRFEKYPTLRFASNTLSKDKLIEKFQEVMSFFLLNSEAIKVLEEVLKKGPLYVIFCKRIGPIDETNFDAAWIPDHRLIAINDSISIEDTLDYFVFEVCNAHNPYFNPGTSEYDLFNIKHFLKDPNGEKTYAGLKELAEFYTSKTCNRIFEHGIRSKVWPESFKKFARADNFPELWKEVTKDESRTWKYWLFGRFLAPPREPHIEGYRAEFRALKKKEEVKDKSLHKTF